MLTKLGPNFRKRGGSPVYKTEIKIDSCDIWIIYKWKQSGIKIVFSINYVGVTTVVNLGVYGFNLFKRNFKIVKIYVKTCV